MLAYPNLLCLLLLIKSKLPEAVIAVEVRIMLLISRNVQLAKVIAETVAKQVTMQPFADSEKYRAVSKLKHQQRLQEAVTVLDALLLLCNKLKSFPFLPSLDLTVSKQSFLRKSCMSMAVDILSF